MECSPRCRAALESARDQAMTLSSSPDTAAETPICADHLRSWVFATSLLSAVGPQDKSFHELCLAWTEALLSWALCRLSRVESSAGGHVVTGAENAFVSSAEIALYQVVLMPRARTVLTCPSRSWDAWCQVSAKLCSSSASLPQDETKESPHAVRDSAITVRAERRSADTFIGAALLVANRDTCQPSWTPGAAKDYESAVSQRLTHTQPSPPGTATPVHSAPLASVVTWYTTHYTASLPCATHLTGQLATCVDTIAYVVCHKVMSGTVARCYALLPFLLDAVTLTYPSADAVSACLDPHHTGEFHFSSPAMDSFFSAVRALYLKQIRAVLKDFTKRSKRVAPIPAASGGAKTALPTYELLVLVVEPTLDVLRRECAPSEDTSCTVRATAAAARARFAEIFAALLRDWLGSVTQEMRAKGSTTMVHALEAERDVWLRWIDKDFPSHAS